MTETPQTRKDENVNHLDREPPTQVDADTIYYYHHSGINVRHGAVPLWLKWVAISLVIWGVIYLVIYW